MNTAIRVNTKNNKNTLFHILKLYILYIARCICDLKFVSKMNNNGVFTQDCMMHNSVMQR